MCSMMFCKLMRFTYIMLALLCDRLINNIKMEPRLSFEQRSEFPPRSPDLTPLDFYRRKPATALWEEIEMAYAAIAEDTFANISRTVVQCTQKCADAHAGHFEQLL